ncbi:heterokaryon incompatibility protein-domain-containing protein [Phaeosphaeria sp. MPI-PUGE-AT-0046c]|nr:heterokaryon incompatibility protein-domain-containing protein [Phaeosphaeria sp. MPI-PUGE-AT-0046c]
MELLPKHVRFAYTQLNYESKEIRLLKVKQDTEPSNPVEITIEHIDFGPYVEAVARRDEELAEPNDVRPVSDERDEAVPSEVSQMSLEFTALSYTWGDELPKSDIIVTSPDSRGWLSVRENLHDFLKLRRQSESPAFWIDQICINQEDDDERAQQVNQMWEIYSCATNVEAWLGPRFDGVDEVMDLLAREGQIKPYQRPAPRFSTSTRQLVAMATSLQYFADLPYWSRLWVTQEIVLGRSVSMRIGDRKIPWTTLFWGAERLYLAWQASDHLEKIAYPRLDRSLFNLIQAAQICEIECLVQWVWLLPNFGFSPIIRCSRKTFYSYF